MKFDFIVGNPPYQDEKTSQEFDESKKNYQPPIYDKFMDNAFNISNIVELITPARFLFNAGSTPKKWNKKVLNDPHFKILDYYENSGDVFVGTNITGGIAISYRNATQNYIPIRNFIPMEQVFSVVEKTHNKAPFFSLQNIVFSRTEYRLSGVAYEDFPGAEAQMSRGHLYDFSSNIFSRFPQLFVDDKVSDSFLTAYGILNNKRVQKYINSKYIKKVQNQSAYKVFFPSANGSPALSDKGNTIVLGAPVVASPGDIHTESFMSLGDFSTINEATNACNYFKTKFFRLLVAALKVTQNNPPAVFENVPLQDFTANSDIDWSKTIPEIDQQLYKKYGLSEEEIEFIETHVKEMN